MSNDQNTLKLNEDLIDPHALGIVRTLQRAGHTTYLVGGCVRDLLIGVEPKDFDIATTAHPSQIKRLVSQAYIIGKRFRLVLVKRGDLQYEVSTFRKQLLTNEDGEALAGPIMDDNLFGSPVEDAQRRDFTINGLFYDPMKEELIDFTEGLPDIQRRIIRMIGNPDVRLEEDPIRILRALRLAHKINFSIDAELRASMSLKAEALKISVLPRKREEILKLLKLAQPSLAFAEAYDLGILQKIMPTLVEMAEKEDQGIERFFLHLDQFERVFHGADEPAPLFAILLGALHRALDPEMPHQKFIDQKPIQEIIRNELGIYKFEALALQNGFQILNELIEFNDFQSRSNTKHLSFMKQDGFNIALHLAEADHILSPHQVYSWKSLQKALYPRLSSMERQRQSVPHRKKRTRRRRTSESRSSERESRAKKESSRPTDA